MFFSSVSDVPTSVLLCAGVDFSSQLTVNAFAPEVPVLVSALLVGVLVLFLGRAAYVATKQRNRISELERQLDRVIKSNESRYEELVHAKVELDARVDQRTTDLRVATQRLSETLEELQQLDRAKTDFFNNVSHELRSPLTLILAPLEDLIAGRTPPGGERAATESMHRNASRLLRLINQLLDLAKIDAGEMRIAPVPTDLVELVASSLKRFEMAAHRKEVTIEFSAPSNMLPVGLDPSWIESAVTNLVANGLRFTKSGGAVRVQVDDRGGDVILSVSDDGPGIAPKDQTKVFERFAQGGNATQVIGGTGIGLALVREAARLHGGDVKLSSELSKGATFSLILPRKPEPLSSAAHSLINHLPSSMDLDEVADQHAPGDRSGPSADAPLALVVDDNRELRDYIADVLATRYRVRTAADAFLAIEAVTKEKPDVLVSDVAMPGMTGYELCRYLRSKEETARTPILLVTARTEVASVLEGFDAGANDYVLKPFHGRELLARVEVHLRVDKLEQELLQRERLVVLERVATFVAHEANNRLNQIISTADTMLSASDGREQRERDQILRILFAAGRIHDMSNDLLRMARLELPPKGRWHVREELEKLAQVVTKSNSRSTFFAVEVEPDLEVAGRPADLNHAFSILFENAAQAAGEGGAVRVRSMVREGHIELLVEDSGPGVDPRDAEEIFGIFVTRWPSGQGNGLGLYLAREVVKEHSGFIRVSRSDLGGACFTVSLSTNSLEH